MYIICTISKLVQVVNYFRSNLVNSYHLLCNIQFSVSNERKLVIQNTDLYTCALFKLAFRQINNKKLSKNINIK